MASEPSVNFWKTVFELLTGPRAVFYSVLLTLISSLFMFASDAWLKSQGMYEFSAKWHWAIFLVFWVALCVFSLSLIQWIGNAALRKWIKYRVVEVKRRHLVNMPNDQLSVAMKYASQEKISLPWGPHSGAVKDLVKRNILYQAGDVLSPIQTYPFALHEDVVKFFTPKGFQRIMTERNKLEVKRKR